MQTDGVKRTTYILIYGVTEQEWAEEEDQIKLGLRWEDPERDSSLKTAKTVEDAVEHIITCEGLEIFVFNNTVRAGKEQLLVEARMIADALAIHENKPWVVLAYEVSYLKPVFMAAEVHVVQRMLEKVVNERWRANQVAAEPATPR